MVDGVLLVGLREIQIDGALQVGFTHLRRALFVLADRDDDVAEVHGIAGAQLGAAVGAHGAAYMTSDGGTTWIDRSTGLDGFLGDVTFLDAHTVMAVGEAGTVVTTTLP